jgi:tetratricopeptide (TPR) repeat protein
VELKPGDAARPPRFVKGWGRAAAAPIDGVDGSGAPYRNWALCMKTMRLGPLSIGGFALLLALGCSPRKEVTERDRKEAAYLVSEAQFALTMREWSRAEGLLAKAVQLSAEGDHWISLGATRLRLKNRAGAKDAYESALKAFQAQAQRNKQTPEPWLKQAYVLALLGRKDDGRAVIAKAAKLFPNDGTLRALNAPKEFERMFSGPQFKEMAL